MAAKADSKKRIELTEDSAPLAKPKKTVGFKKNATLNVEPETDAASETETKPTKAAKKPPRKRAPRKKKPITFKSVHVDSNELIPVIDLETKRYWVGAVEDAPFECRHAFGVTFQKWSGVVEADPRTGKLVLDRASRGLIVELTDEQVVEVQNSIARKIVRTTGNREDATGNYRCDTHNVLASGFRTMPKDTPLGRYMYMIEVDELMPHGWRETAEVPVMDQG